MSEMLSSSPMTATSRHPRFRIAVAATAAAIATALVAGPLTSSLDDPPASPTSHQVIKHV